MDDDELRERLRAMPEPTTAIDVDAVVTDARRRRRPKVIGTGVAVGAACLAFLAPVVVPGLLGPDPVTSTLQEAGVAEQGDSGAEPEAPAPAATSEAPTSAEEAQPTDQADPAPTYYGDQGASGCPFTEADVLQPGLVLSFAAPPADGVTTLLVENQSSAAIVVRIGDVGVATYAGGVLAGLSVLDPASSLDGPVLRLAPGEVASLDVAVDLHPVGCGGSGGLGGITLPLVAIALGEDAVVQQRLALGTAP
ncbi:hypothetical protein [Agrococcus jejuensis]|uniref:hypothetical protein n=1 Tax=Agrococcus jejuensis TaxID=399736 RepID=UPI0011A1BDF0|nr:hypothetical protein [Agrococcus jejuensis]